MASLIERHDEDVLGVLSCYDRVVIHGTLPGFNYADGMTSYLEVRGIRIFDYTKFAEPLRDRLRRNAEKLAEDNGLSIQFVRKSNVRKEDIVHKALDERGDEPGLVCILSAMETCQSYKPWHSAAFRFQHSGFSHRSSAGMSRYC